MSLNAELLKFKSKLLKLLASETTETELVVLIVGRSWLPLSVVEVINS